MEIDTALNTIAAWEASNSWLSNMVTLLAYAGLGWLLYAISRHPIFDACSAAIVFGFVIMAFGQGLSASNSELVGMLASLIPLLVFAVIGGAVFLVIVILAAVIWTCEQFKRLVSRS